MSTRTHRCDNCGVKAAAPVVRRAAGVSTGRGMSIGPLPRSWERYRADDPFSPTWCGDCIGMLLSDLLDAMRRSPMVVGTAEVPAP